MRCPRAELRTAHEHAGIHIGADTAIQNWDKSSPDYNWIEDRIQSYEIVDPDKTATAVNYLMQRIEVLE